MRQKELETQSHLLYNSLPSRLPIELLVMLYDPVFTVSKTTKQCYYEDGLQVSLHKGQVKSLTSKPEMGAPLKPGWAKQAAFLNQTWLHPHWKMKRK